MPNSEKIAKAFFAVISFGNPLKRIYSLTDRGYQADPYVRYVRARGWSRVFVGDFAQSRRQFAIIMPLD